MNPSSATFLDTAKKVGAVLEKHKVMPANLLGFLEDLGPCYNPEPDRDPEIVSKLDQILNIITEMSEGDFTTAKQVAKLVGVNTKSRSDMHQVNELLKQNKLLSPQESSPAGYIKRITDDSEPTSEAAD